MEVAAATAEDSAAVAVEVAVATAAVAMAAAVTKETIQKSFYQDIENVFQTGEKIVTG